MKKFSPLAVISLHTGSIIAHPATPPEIVHIDDPALHAMTNLKQANAVTIGPDAPITEAALEMRVCHTHLLLVVNKDNYVIGLISSEDILGEKPLKITMERRIRRAEIQVRMVMTPQEHIAALPIEGLGNAKVGNIIATLHELRQHYALVVETDAQTGIQMVDGLFSLHQISKQLGEDVTLDLSEAHSIYELQQGFKG